MGCRQLFYIIIWRHSTSHCVTWSFDANCLVEAKYIFVHCEEKRNAHCFEIKNFVFSQNRLTAFCRDRIVMHLNDVITKLRQVTLQSELIIDHLILKKISRHQRVHVFRSTLPWSRCSQASENFPNGICHVMTTHSCDQQNLSRDTHCLTHHSFFYETLLRTLCDFTSCQKTLISKWKETLKCGGKILNPLRDIWRRLFLKPSIIQQKKQLSQEHE